MNGIERPLDLLNQCKGHDVIVCVKDKEAGIEGKLYAFDIHINLVIESKDKGMTFVRGDIVETIKPKNKKIN